MICASIKESSMSEIVRKMRDVPGEYDLIEIWINEIKDLSFEELISASDRPLLIKVTDVSDKSLIEGSIRNNVSYIDIDLKADAGMINFVKDNKYDTKLIVSHHEFNGTPSFRNALELLGEIKDTGADVAKIVFKALKMEDNLVPLRLLSSASGSGLPLISFCMGRLGRMSRIMAGSIGSLIEFVPPDENWQTAEGQIVYDEWKTLQGFFK